MTTAYPPKSAWGPGPWQQEPDCAEWRDRASSLRCLARRSPATGAWCGYVGVYPGHPLYGKGYDDVDVEVHGGLTFSGVSEGDICHTPEPGEPEVHWFGFDCGHDGDFMPTYVALGVSHLLNGRYRTLAYVKRECMHLAEQLHRLR